MKNFVIIILMMLPIMIPTMSNANPIPDQEGLYRGKDAETWAKAYRYRTHQLLKTRAVAKQKIKAVIKEPHGNSWLERAVLCIHSGEGAWDDPNAPYYGGVQMDLSFQRHYGAWALKAFGTADKWPKAVQIAVAIRAHEEGRGFYPWPNTAKNCGLI